MGEAHPMTQTEHSLVVSTSDAYDQKYESELSDYLEWPGVEVTTAAEREQFVALASETAKYIKRVKAFFKTTREPFKKAMDEHKAMEKKELVVPTKFLDAVKLAIQAFDEKVERENTARLKALEESGTPTAVTTALAPKPKGTRAFHTKKIPTGYVTDVRKVCQLIADGELPESMVSFSQAAINGLAKQWGEALGKKYPGLAFKEKKSSAVS